MADVDGSGVGGGEPSPAYGAAAGGAAPDAAAVQAQGMRQRRAAQDAAVEEHKGKNLDEMRAELAKKRALVADMRKWNNRLNVVLMIVIVPFSALVCASLRLARSAGAAARTHPLLVAVLPQCFPCSRRS